MYDKELVARLKSKNLTVYEEVYEIRMGISMKCTRNCSFCGISRKPTEDMTQATLDSIIQSATPRLRKLCMSVYGESIMHPEVADYMYQLRKAFPKLQISTITNTDYFRKRGFKLLLEMFDSGLNYVIADLYDEKQDEWFFDALRSNEEELRKREIEIKDFYTAGENIWGYHGTGKKKIFIVRDKDGPGSGGSVSTRAFHTYGGNLDMKHWPEKVKNIKFPMKAVCAEPLKYLTITSDGGVFMCCRDGGLSGRVGNVNEHGINDIWQGDTMQIARYVLATGRRDLMIPCILCNARTFRSGLYPYWGRQDYSREELVSALRSLSYIEKSQPIYSNLMKYMETGWEPTEIIAEVLREAK